MIVQIDCYGPAARWCGADRLTLELPSGATISVALDHLEKMFPELSARRASIAAAIDDTVLPQTATLQPGNRLALIPPVSGG